MVLPDEQTAEHAALTPFDLPHVQFVDNFQELAETPFSGQVNALCWKRHLPGDFAEIIAGLGNNHGQPMLVLDRAVLEALSLSAAGSTAREWMLSDLSQLSERQLAPALNCVYGYPRDDRGGPIATDVFSYHIDSAPCATDTWLCTYHGPASEGLSNQQAERRIDNPETHAALLAAYGRADDAEFRAFISENAYDLHYGALPLARPYSFGIGNLWRIATKYPGCPVLPSIHRAPRTKPGDPPRLLLIS